MSDSATTTSTIGTPTATTTVSGTGNAVSGVETRSGAPAVPTTPAPISLDLSTEERLDRLEAAVAKGLNLDLGEFDTPANQAKARKAADKAAADEASKAADELRRAGGPPSVSPGNISVATDSEGVATTTWSDGSYSVADADGKITKQRTAKDADTPGPTDETTDKPASKKASRATATAK